MDLKIIHQVLELLDELSVKYWIDQGSLLGFYRDGKLMEWDKDFDLGVIYESQYQMSTICEHLSKKFSYCHYDRFYKAIKNFFNVNKEEQWAIDISFHYKIDGHYVKHWPDYHAMSYLKRWAYEVFHKYLSNPVVMPLSRNLVKKSIVKFLQFFFTKIPLTTQENLHVKFIPCITLMTPVDYFENTKKFSIDNYTYIVSKNVEQYLHFKYGENWKTPNSTWDYLCDDGAIISSQEN